MWKMYEKRRKLKKNDFVRLFFKDKSQKSRAYEFIKPLSTRWIGNVYLNGRIFFFFLLISVFYPYRYIVYVLEKAMHLWMSAPSQVVCCDWRKSLRVCISSAFHFAAYWVCMCMCERDANEYEKSENNNKMRDEKKNCENSLKVVAFGKLVGLLVWCDAPVPCVTALCNLSTLPHSAFI